MRTAKGKIRKQGPDYLAYSMIDAVVDHYFVIMEKLGDRFEDLEDAVVANPEPGVLPTIYNLKRDMLDLRRSVWPLREAISKMQRTDSPLVSETTKIYLRDVYDHTIQVIENIETFRDMSGILAGDLPLQFEQPPQRGDKAPDHHLHHLHSPHLPGGRVRDELRFYAGAEVALGLPGRPDLNAAGSGGVVSLFPEEGLDLRGPGQKRLY